MLAYARPKLTGVLCDALGADGVLTSEDDEGEPNVKDIFWFFWL